MLYSILCGLMYIVATVWSMITLRTNVGNNFIELKEFYINYSIEFYALP
jgi:hypothetical protein